MRYLVAFVLLVAGAAAGLLVYRHLNAGVAVVLPPPRLQISSSGTPFSPGGWSNSSRLDLRAVRPGVTAGVDVEVRKREVKFTGTPTQTLSSHGQVAAICADCIVAGSGPIHIRLADGLYHLQARLHNKEGVSPWVPYHGAIKVDTTPPTPAQITSSTDPLPSKTYHKSTLHFSWRVNDAGSGTAGYSYRLDDNLHGTARHELRTNGTSVTLNGLTTGTWYFHVSALDRAGNWGQNATFPVHIDVTPPGLTHVRFNLFQLDPQFDRLRVSFAVTRQASTVRVGIYRQSNGSAIRLYTLTGLQKGEVTGIAWDGKDGQGSFAPAGMYEVYIRTIDRYGHSKLTGWNDFALNYRRILVSLSRQKLWAFDGSKLLWTSLVTTGNRALPTPIGTYHVIAKLHPFTFHSPWPKTSPYYYKPSKSEYAMLFREGGYFIHDASWRSNFGPGSNARLGTPGSNFTGTHGCVNVPPTIARDLFDWSQLGTVVQIVS